jgi:predicted Zn-dependent protease
VIMFRSVPVLLLALAFAAVSQGQAAKKNQPQTNNNGAPVYSDDDKKKLAEIAQRPVVQQEIEDAWNGRRKADLDEAYSYNRTATWAISDNPVGDGNRDPKTIRLYNNPMMQMYVNSIGQRLIPKNSPNLYTFRIVLYPLPQASSLSTGSIYITTGLLSMLDSEAQLSYILAHEIAHVEQKHEYNRTRDEVLESELNKEKEAKNAQNKALITAGAGLLGGLVGGAAKGLTGAITGVAIGAIGGYIASDAFLHSGVRETNWNLEQENEADALGTKYMLDQNYDAREIPRLYASLDRMVSKDSRVGLSFLGDPRRVKERSGHIQELLNGPMKEQLTKIKSGGAVGSGTEFPVLLAAAKRDNAIMAMQYDLFAMAQANLEDALVQRSNDPSVHFQLSRVLTMTARTPETRHDAVQHIQDALKLDSARGYIPDLHLEMAMSLLMQGNSADKDQIIGELKTYVALYERDNSGGLPGNMSAIVDYFNLVGETGWYLPPSWYPATQLMNSNATINPSAVVRKAFIVGDNAAGTPVPASGDSTPKPAPRTKPVSAPGR